MNLYKRLRTLLDTPSFPSAAGPTPELRDYPFARDRTRAATSRRASSG